MTEETAKDDPAEPTLRARDAQDPAWKDKEGQKLPKKPLAKAAQRALAEAEERRRRMDARPPLPKELHGRNGPEPTRYGDWEKDGIISDF